MDVKDLRVLIVGAGGTGSAALPLICRMLYAKQMGEQSESRYKMPVFGICDADTISESNLRRQNFYEDELGENKAVVLAQRAKECFDMEFKAFPRYLESVDDVNFVFRELQASTWGAIPVLCVCVDNLRARRVFEEWFDAQRNAVMIDSANEEFCGEVVCSVKIDGKKLSPYRSEVFPSFFELLKKEPRFRSELDCATRGTSSPQQFETNQQAALILATKLVRFVKDKEIPYGVSYFDTRTGFESRSFEDTRGLLKQPEKPKKRTPRKKAVKSNE